MYLSAINIMAPPVTVTRTFVLLVSLVLVPQASCSVGDRSHDFRSCVSFCVANNCSQELSLDLRLLGWDCQEDCQYQCMHHVTAEDVRAGRRVRQFYGKWPFVRILGVQEPASMLFSVLNAATILYGFICFRRQAHPEYHYLTMAWVQFIVSMHTWFWSAVFHSRDLYWTERLDYFSAASMIVVALLFQFVRISGPAAVTWHWLYTALWVFLFSAHVCYLALIKFDYGYNMAASVGAGILYTAVWLFWCMKNRRQRWYTWKCAVVVLSTTLFVSLELLDFPPLWWTFDAHSLWHLSTIPLPLFWYSFLTDDAQFEVEKFKKGV